MRALIIGAGMAGLSCAARLMHHGHDVALFDKGRGPGGRMSARRTSISGHEVRFDHGAQYFTARDPDFKRVVDRWVADGDAAPWPAAGGDAYVGIPAMNQPVRRIAAMADVRFGTRIDMISRGEGGWSVGGERGDGIIIAVPAEQAAPLLEAHDPDFADIAARTPSAPCWTVMMAFADRLDHGDIMRDCGAIGWAVRDSAKPDRANGERWIIQAGPDWSAAHLEQDADVIAARLSNLFADAIGSPLPPVLHRAAHRWRYARSGNAERGALWNDALALGACGDWLSGPRVENAWLSGRELADRIGPAS